MGVSPDVAAWLRNQGHDAVHLREQGLHRLDDPAIFTKAGLEERILLTCDLEFAEIVAFSGNRTVSVILFRLASMRPRRAIERLSRVLMESSPALGAGAVVVVEDARHRGLTLSIAPVRQRPVHHQVHAGDEARPRARQERRRVRHPSPAPTKWGRACPGPRSEGRGGGIWACSARSSARCHPRNRCCRATPR